MAALPGVAMAIAADAVQMAPALSTTLPELSLYCLVQVVAFVPCFFVVRRYWPNHKDPWTLADTMVSVAIFPLLTMSAILGSKQLYGDLESRWFQSTATSLFFMRLYATRAFLHLFIQSMQRMTWTHWLLMTLHHFLSMVCYGCGLATGRMHYWGCLDGCCEMSTIFLNNLYMTKEVTIGGKELKEIMPGWVYGFNGALLWLSFLVFRIILFPWWLYSWYQDVTTFPEKTWDRTSAIERYLYPAVTAFLLCLSAFWFVSVSRGMLKVLGIGGSRASGSAQAGKVNGHGKPAKKAD